MGRLQIFCKKIWKIPQWRGSLAASLHVFVWLNFELGFNSQLSVFAEFNSGGNSQILRLKEEFPLSIVKYSRFLCDEN